MFIKIFNLSDGVHNYSFNEPVEKIDLTEPFFGDFIVNVELSKFQHQILLNAEIILNAGFCCDRCNTDFKTKLVTEYKMVYLFGENPVESEAVNVTYLPFDADKIMLKNDVRDYALLSIPMKKLCKEDCKGLCINCGKNLNEEKCNCPDKAIDERWLPLIELKKKINTN